MKITYEYPDGRVVRLKAPKSVIYGLDDELETVMSEVGSGEQYPHLRELWFNTVGEHDESDLDVGDKWWGNNEGNCDKC